MAACTAALWEHALEHLMATASTPETLLAQWRDERPEACSDRDLLREYAWVVFSCGLTPHVMIKHWDNLSTAFQGWAPELVAHRSNDARIAALGIMRNPRKIDAVLMMAWDLCREPGLMKRLAAMPMKQVLARLITLPFVGAANRFHLARNLGWDVVVRTGPVTRLAACLETTSAELCGAIAAGAGERIRTVDLVLWFWGHQVGETAMKETASLFRLL